MTSTPRMTACKLARFGLITADADRLADFYVNAFGFRPLSADRVSGAGFNTPMDVEGGAKRVEISLGDDVVELLEFDTPSAPYPEGTSSSDLIFQHFAIVTKNIEQAFQRLSTMTGWSAISRGGPQRLPESSGGVTAFKFRDPDGHPLELLAFPDDRVPALWKSCAKSPLCLGIDHSAVCVSDTAQSIAFYQGLGFQVSARSINRGAEQERLDGIDDPRVEVTALSLGRTTPHVELLCYQSVTPNQKTTVPNSNIAATRLVFEIESQPSAETCAAFEQRMFDPDGHRLVFVSPITRG